MSRQLKRPARSPHTVGTQDQETHQVPTGHWGFRIRRPARSPRQWVLKKEGRSWLWVSLKKSLLWHMKDLSVLGDLHYWKSRQSKQYLQPVFGAILLPREHRGRTSGTNTAPASSPRSVECWVLPRHTFKGIPKAVSSQNHPEALGI